MKVRKDLLCIILTACLGISLLTIPAHAALMSDLFLPGGEIIAVDKRFYDWTLIDPGPFPEVPNFLEVQPLEDDPLNPGLKYFTSPSTPFPPLPVNFTWGYKVAVESPLYIIDNSLRLLVETPNGSLLRVSEDVWTDESKTTHLGFKEVIYEDGFIFDYIEILLPPSKELYIEKNLIIEPVVPFFGFEQRFSQTPVPGALWLFCSGLIALLGFRRKFRKI